jgi:hypothetical protein
MPLTSKGEKIEAALTKEYGETKGEQVLYAGKNKGTFSGIDAIAEQTQIVDARGVSKGPGMDAVLNWGGGVNAQKVEPGGKADTGSMPAGARRSTAIGSGSSNDDGLPELKKEFGKFIEREEKEEEHK